MAAAAVVAAAAAAEVAAFGGCGVEESSGQGTTRQREMTTATNRLRINVTMLHRFRMLICGTPLNVTKALASAKEVPTPV